jgi:glycosyltransferase involved in cell wall biosynthesis
MKHIVLVTTSFPDEAFRNGQEAAGAFVADFASSLSQFAQITVVAPSNLNHVEKKPNLSIHRFTVPRLPLSLLKPHIPSHWISIAKSLYAGQQAVKKIIRETSTDHVLAFWALPSGYWSYRACRELKIPFSVWALGSDIWSLGRIPVIRNVLRMVLRHSTHRFADGFMLANDVKSISGLDCSFLPSSRRILSEEKSRLSVHPPYRLAFLGRWHRNKGIDLLMKSLKFLRNEDWSNIEAIKICGGGPLERIVMEEVSNLQILGYPVTSKGYLNRKEATDLMEWSDYILIPSRIESIPVIFSDAMQTYCPVITMPVGDLPHLIRTYEVGFLAQEVTSEAFTRAIQDALYATPNQFDLNIKKIIGEFNIERTAKRLIEILFNDSI